MLDRAARKEPGPEAAPVEWVRATRWPCPSATTSFAAATIAFGVRNLPDVEAGLRELARVVRPGGRVVCLEITQPTAPPLSWFYDLWFDRLIPALGRVLRRHRLLVPAGVGAPLPRAGRARRALFWQRGPEQRPLPPPRPAASSPCTWARCRGERSRPRRRHGSRAPATRPFLRRVEERLGATVAAARRRRGRAGARDAGRRRQAPAPAAVLLSAPAERRADARRRDRGRRRGRARAHGDAGPRRRARRGPAPPRRTRRSGRRTARRIARATGDYLFARAFAELAAHRRPRRGRASSRTACARPGPRRGAAGEQTRRPETSVEASLERCRLKTGRLFAAACALGGRLGGLDDADVAALERFGSRPRAGLPAGRRRCSTATATRRAPARRSAPTCSTAP